MSSARTEGSRGASQLGRAASLVIAKGFAGELVEPPRSNIFLKLPVPYRSLVLSKPLAEPRQIPLGETLHRTSDFFHGTHIRIVPENMLSDNLAVRLVVSCKVPIPNRCPLLGSANVRRPRVRWRRRLRLLIPKSPHPLYGCSPSTGISQRTDAAMGRNRQACVLGVMTQVEHGLAIGVHIAR